MPLEEYNKKRDFKQTAEPKGARSKTSGKLRFVVQRHAASRLHYDFRLEMEGVLKSWAVPKGPSLNPADKRLAMMVEDHPYSYRTFEGTIPQGNYGAGEVEIWDEGFYEPLHKKTGLADDKILLNELKTGSLKIVLKGNKLKGEFALVKIKNPQDDNAWLLIKHKDAFAVTGKYSAEDFTKKNSKVTQLVAGKKKKLANKIVPAEKEDTSKKTVESKRRVTNHAPYISGEQKLKDYVKPMLATLTEEPFSDDEWVFEIKWDGYRAIAETGSTFRFYSRNGLSFANKYAPITEELKSQQHEMILDGEIVAYDNGKPSFQSLQHYSDHSATPLIYHVFDILYLNGHSTESLTLLQRKELLKDALVEGEHIKYCDYLENDGIGFFEAIKENNLEGIIAKMKSGEYTRGVRTRQWLKIKYHNITEAVIAGFTEPRGSRKAFGALILGRYENGELVYTGHTGTGFNQTTLKEIYARLQPLIIKDCPFAKKPKTNMPATWVKPELVCNIKYTEITDEHIYRHPVYMGLRIDKSASEVDNSDSTQPEPAPKKSKPVKKSNHTEGDVIKSIGGKQVKLTNQSKVYWPNEGYTKGDLIDYYQDMSAYILPYLKDRPQSLHRFPNGIKELSFYHKDAGAGAPDWVKTVNIYSASNDKELEYILCNDKATLAYLNNLGCIELNPWNSRIKKIDHPDYMIIDIDPADKNTFEQVIETAQATKEILDICKVDAYCKTSGSTGLHVFVPMGAKYTYDQVKDFAHIIADLVQKRLPKFTTLERNLKKRGNNKIYIDYLQNRSGQTIASIYSVRPKPGASVSMPLEWGEVKKGLSPADFHIHNACERVKMKGDIFRGVMGKGVDIAKCLTLLEEEINK